MLNLAALTPADIDFAAMANALSKIARHATAIREAGLYSTAEHSVTGADVLMDETGDTMVAGYFLLYDAWEYLTGPMWPCALAMLDHRCSGTLPGVVTVTATELFKRLRAIIFEAACLAPIEMMPARGRQVLDMKARMKRAEVCSLYGHAAAKLLPADVRPPPRIVGAIRPGMVLRRRGSTAAGAAPGLDAVAEVFIDRLGRYCGVHVR